MIYYLNSLYYKNKTKGGKMKKKYLCSIKSQIQCIPVSHLVQTLARVSTLNLLGGKMALKFHNFFYSSTWGTFSCATSWMPSGHPTHYLVSHGLSNHFPTLSGSIVRLKHGTSKLLMRDEADILNGRIVRHFHKTCLNLLAPRILFLFKQFQLLIRRPVRHCRHAKHLAVIFWYEES